MHAMALDFARHARAFGIELAPAQLGLFETYCAELVAWNRRVNLTAITARDDIYLKHFLDALSLAPILRAHANDALIDIGSGAGFPGIPLKIIFPSLRVALLEATGKKVTFLDHLIATLQLRDVVAIHARAEELAHQPAHRERYAVATARAVADLATLIEYALPLIVVEGILIAQKGMEVEAEIQAAARALKELSGRVREIVPVQLPGLEPRHLIVVEKIAATPAKYPRRAGMPEKNPLR
jgi:16S rRNA (guanine527-N7)-methyltransferase